MNNNETTHIVKTRNALTGKVTTREVKAGEDVFAVTLELLAQSEHEYIVYSVTFAQYQDKQDAMADPRG